METPISKDFGFSNFEEALAFINKIAQFMIEQDHHPDILLHDYKFVRITSITHSENKVTEKDHKLMKDIEDAYEMCAVQ